MKKTLSVALMSAMVLSGCSAFRSHTQDVNVACNTEGAILMINGDRYGNQAQVAVSRDNDMVIQCMKKGYYTQQRTINSNLNGTGMLDAVGTFILLLPGFGLFTPGAWSLEQTDVSIELFKKES